MKERGYTLLEIMISIFIFGLMVSLIFYALSQGLYQYKSVIQKTSTFWEKSKILWLHKIFSSTIDYYVKDEEWFPFFEGESNIIVFISESSIAENLPVMAIISSEKSESGKKRLVYYELPVYTLNYKEIKEIINSEVFKKYRKIIILDNLDSISFEYFGGDISKESADWYSYFSGKKQKTLPQFVKITLRENDTKKSLFFALKNNSNLKEVYNEIY
ncbi:MAG: prepilin-type N-terminal cleavage/methylation domain-containing protein [candidate division WOR-3 bacterium]